MPMFGSVIPNDTSSALTNMDRFEQLVGGGSQDTSWGSSNPGRNPLDPDGGIYKWAKQQVEAMKTYRAKFDTNWDSYYAMVKGNQWNYLGAPGVTPRYNRQPGWRSRVIINLIRPIMSEINATIYDNEPRLVINPTDPWQMQNQYVETMQAALDEVTYRQKLGAKARDSTWNCLTYGNGYLKFCYDPSENNGEGAICIDVVPTQNLFVDKFAVDIKSAKILGERKYVALSELKRMYPDKAHLLQPDTAYGSYAEQVTQDGELNNPINKQLQIFTPADDNPRYADKTVFTNPPYRRAAGRTEPVEEVWELWIKDYDWEEYEEDYIAGWDMWRRPVHATRLKRRRKYPYGRVMKIGGGTLLQDTKNVYRVPMPYAMIQDWTDPCVFYADGEPAILSDSQREYNKRRAQLMDTIAATANPITFYETDSGFIPSMLSNAPGQMIGLKPDKIGKVQRLPAPELPSYFMQTLEMPKSDMMFQAGISGGRVTGRSGTAAQEQVSSDTKRTRLKSKNVKDFLQDCGEILITFIQDFYTPAKMIRIMGNAENASFAMFDRNNVRGQWDLRIETSTESANNKVARRQEAIQLRTLGTIDDRNVLETLEWPGREEVLRRKTGVVGPPHQVPTYKGWPGMPYGNRGRGMSGATGYSLEARAEPAQPPPPPGPPAGFNPTSGKKGAKKKSSPAGRMPGF